MSYLAHLLLASVLLPGAPGRTRPKPVHNIRQVDFKNFVYNADGETVRVRRGHGSYSERGDMDFAYSVERVQVSYGDLTGDGRDEAAVTLHYYDGGGTGAFSKGFVFTLRRGRLALLTHFEGGDRAAGGIREAAVEGGLLRVRRNEPERMNDVPVGLCCPVSVITTRYRWDGRALVQVGKPEKVEVDSEN